MSFGLVKLGRLGSLGGGGGSLLKWILTITKTGNGTVDPDVGSHKYAKDSNVTVTATETDADYYFEKFVEDSVDKTTNPLTVTMLANKLINCIFKEKIQILTTTQTASNVQIPLTLLIDSGKKVKIDWGNGTITEAIGTGVAVVYTSNYSGAGTFNIKFFGDTAFIKSFGIVSTDAVMTLPFGIVNWKKLTGLTSLTLYALPNFTSTGNHIDLPRVTNYMRLYSLPNFTSTGNHIDLPRVTDTLYLYALPNFTSTGNISTIPNVTTTLYITLCPLVSITVDTPPTWTTTTITLQVGWSTANVDLFIVNWAQVTGASTKTVNIAGNNGLVSTGDSAVAAALVVLQNKLKSMLYNY